MQRILSSLVSQFRVTTSARGHGMNSPPPQYQSFFLETAFQSAIAAAKGNNKIETPTQPKSTPKSIPIRECVPNSIVREPSTTVNMFEKHQQLYCKHIHEHDIVLWTYCGEGAKCSPIYRTLVQDPEDKNPWIHWK